MKIKENLLQITTSQSNLAQALKLTPPRISAMIKSGIIVKDDSDRSGGVYIFESLKNYYQRHSSDNDVDFNQERALHERAKRQIAELKLEKAEDLVKLRTRLLTIPSKLAPMIEGKSKGEIDLILTREIEDTLAEMSNFDPSVFISEDIDDEDE